MSDSNRWYEGTILVLKENEIFVFGSNTEGRHGAGAAKFARDKFGAKYGQARGLQGRSYAIVTKDLKKGYKSRTVDQIAEEIKNLYAFVRENKELRFLIAYCPMSAPPLNGYSYEDLAGIFSLYKIPTNIIFEQNFYDLVMDVGGVYEL